MAEDPSEKPEKEMDIGRRGEIPPPTTEQMTALWLSLHNISIEPSLISFFAGQEKFPVKPENYASYAETFTKYFDLMRKVLSGDKLSELGFAQPEVPLKERQPSQSESGYLRNYLQGMASTEDVPKIKATTQEAPEQDLPPFNMSDPLKWDSNKK